jgi:NAD(P)H dehydrogenase (quinone)
MPKDSVKDLIQKKMSEVDEYVFVFPVWWGWVPAILKNFFDTNLSSWFAFKFWKNGVQKLLNDKTAKVFCTCDAPGFIYKFPFFIWVNLKKFLSRAILGFCWIKLKSFNIYSSLRSKTEEQKKKILENIW